MTCSHLNIRDFCVAKQCLIKIAHTACVMCFKDHEYCIKLQKNDDRDNIVQKVMELSVSDHHCINNCICIRINHTNNIVSVTMRIKILRYLRKTYPETKIPDTLFLRSIGFKAHLLKPKQLAQIVKYHVIPHWTSIVYMISNNEYVLLSAVLKKFPNNSIIVNSIHNTSKYYINLIRELLKYNKYCSMFIIMNYLI